MTTSLLTKTMSSSSSLPLPTSSSTPSASLGVTDVDANQGETTTALEHQQNGNSNNCTIGGTDPSSTRQLHHHNASHHHQSRPPLSSSYHHHPHHPHPPFSNSRRHRFNSTSSVPNDASSDTQSGYASSFDSVSSYSDDPFMVGVEEEVVTHGREEEDSESPTREELVTIHCEGKQLEMLIEENLCVFDLCHLIKLKLNRSTATASTLVLQFPDLCLEQALQDEKEVLPQMQPMRSLMGYKHQLVLNLNHVDFIQTPWKTLCLNMISFEELDKDAKNYQKTALLQDQLTGSQVLKLTMLGHLEYHKEEHENQVSEPKRVTAHIKCPLPELRCTTQDPPTEMVFDLRQHWLFYPMNDLNCKTRTKANNNYIFALIHEEDQGIHWFVAESEEHRRCWISVIHIVKYGLGNLRSAYERIHKDTLDSFSPSSSCPSMGALPRHESPSDILIEKVGEPRRRESSGTAIPITSTPIVSFTAPLPVPSSRRDHYDIRTDRTLAHQNEPWFYPDLSRFEAAQCLQKYMKIDGVFLVRPSQRNPGTYVISYVYEGRVHHQAIGIVEEDGEAFVSLDGGRTRFYDLKQLVEFYQLNRVFLPTLLTHFLVHK